MKRFRHYYLNFLYTDNHESRSRAFTTYQGVKALAKVIQDEFKWKRAPQLKACHIYFMGNVPENDYTERVPLKLADGLNY